MVVSVVCQPQRARCLAVSRALALWGRHTVQRVILWSVVWIWLMVGQSEECNWHGDKAKVVDLCHVWTCWLSYERLPRSSVLYQQCGILVLNINKFQILFFYLTLECVSFLMFLNIKPFKHMVIFLIGKGNLFHVNGHELVNFYLFLNTLHYVPFSLDVF